MRAWFTSPNSGIEEELPHRADDHGGQHHGQENRHLMKAVTGQTLEEQERDQERGAVLDQHQRDEHDDVVGQGVVGPGAERLLEEDDAEILEPDEAAARQPIPGKRAVQERRGERDCHEGKHDDERRREQTRDPEPAAEIVLKQESRLREIRYKRPRPTRNRPGDVASLAHLQVKWTRFTVDDASEGITRADSI